MASTLLELMRNGSGGHVASRWLELHPTGTGLAQALSQNLRSAQRADEVGPGEGVLGALRQLAPISAGAREVLLPSVLSQRVRDYTCGEGSPDASHQISIMRDTYTIGGLCQRQHVYDALCERGFKRARTSTAEGLSPAESAAAP